MSSAELAAAEAAAVSEHLAQTIGMHMKGRTVVKVGAIDEEDPARWVWHKALKQAAAAGMFAEAEHIVADMQRAPSSSPPGPRAYHALVFSYVKGRSAAGALGAIRRCWEAGITPLPETYAAVVHAHILAGDLDTAEAVCASNRRVGVDCTQSWQLLTTAQFKAGQTAKAMEAFSQVCAAGAAVVVSWVFVG